jgi:hypothetical protein
MNDPQLTEALNTIPPLTWEVDDRPIRTYKVWRIYDTFYRTVEGIGRIVVYNDWLYGEYWAKRSEL